MKLKVLLAALLFCTRVDAQEFNTARNVFIITTDGFRWEEVFRGADSALISSSRYVKDTALAKAMFWDSTEELRRKKLFPFLWTVIARHGQIYGNRSLDNYVNVKNFYKISYPGYNEMLTGFADPFPIFNSPVPNRNTTVLEYLNRQPAFKGKVVAFSSWNIIPYIFNEQRSGVDVNSGYEMLGEADENSKMIDSVQLMVKVKTNTRHDQLTFLSAKEYIEQHHPRAVFLGFGETDECAHHGNYDLYLQKAAAVDKMLAELWYYIQTDPIYKDNTTLIVSTDHGRGKKGASWRNHGFWVRGSGEIWLAMLGPGILPLGEMANANQIWQKQIAPTAALSVGEYFKSKQSIGPPANFPSTAKLSAVNPAKLNSTVNGSK
jgi:hypothetical protein